MTELHPRERVVDGARCELTHWLLTSGWPAGTNYGDLITALIRPLHKVVPTTDEDRIQQTFEFVGSLREKYNLTPGEVIMLMAHELAQVAKYIIRVERHGNTSTPGGEAP